ncbi:DUF6268 family outer membrane beta-barrel protein [Chryseolinea sp. T2]|uniref:DUF6268 family outer membrane beta-barrel protein n=1 Tax=Chryseolinea sp. T2 TaxID=3129255 RepID=UPI0030770227
MGRPPVAAPLPLLAVALICIPLSSRGQDYIDLIRINYSRSGYTRFEGTDNKTRIVDFGVDTNVPIPVNNHVTFLSGLTYEAVDTKLYRDENAHTLQIAGLKLGINFIPDKRRWMATILMLPRVSTDFTNLNRHCLQMGGLIVFRKTVNRYANYKVGLYANREFFGTWIVPMVGFYYHRPDKPWEVIVFLPVSFDVNYALTTRVRAGVVFTGMRRSYQLSAIPTYGGAGYLDRTANDFGGYLSWQFAKGTMIQSKATYSLGRESKVYSRDDKISVGFPLASIGDNRTQLNDNVADGWQVQLLFIYRLRFNRND